MRWALVAAACCGLLACKGNYEAKVEGVWIPQADGVVEAKDGATVAVTGTEPVERLPQAEVVRFAIARDVPWQDVKALVAKAEAAGAEPVLLVGRGPNVRALRISDELEGERHIEVFTTTEGKACVGPPDARKYKCVQRGDRIHVDRAFLRQLVREAVKAYHLQDVSLELPPELGWADVVRSIDGVRTCCGDTEVRVRVEG